MERYLSPGGSIPPKHIKTDNTDVCCHQGRKLGLHEAQKHLSAEQDRIWSEMNNLTEKSAVISDIHGSGSPLNAGAGGGDGSSNDMNGEGKTSAPGSGRIYDGIPKREFFSWSQLHTLKVKRVTRLLFVFQPLHTNECPRPSMRTSCTDVPQSPLTHDHTSLRWPSHNSAARNNTPGLGIGGLMVS